MEVLVKTCLAGFSSPHNCITEGKIPVLLQSGFIRIVDVTAKGKLLCFFDFWVSRTNEMQLVIFLCVRPEKK